MSCSEMLIIIFATKKCDNNPSTATIKITITVENVSTAIPPNPEAGNVLSKCSIIGTSTNFDIGAPMF